LNAADQPASAKRDPERASSIRKGEAAGSEHFSSFGAADQRP